MNTAKLDFILNGVGHGDVASSLIACDFNTNMLRPYRGNDGRTYVTMRQNGVDVPVPVNNNNATLTKDAWIHLDTQILKAARPALKLVSDIVGAGLTLNIPNGMGTSVLQTQRQTDLGDAQIGMDPIVESDRDRQEFDITNLPLPVIFKDFSFSARDIAVGARSGQGLDTTQAELAGRKVSEIVESLTIGSHAQYKFGGGTIYGLTNFPDRQTHEITAPTESGWTPEVLVLELLAMRQKLEDAFQNGPYNLYFGRSWNQYLDKDYRIDGGNNPSTTLRKRVAQIEGFSTPKKLDFLSGFQIIVVQMTSDVIREVIGMNMTTVQWPSMGGLKVNFKVMCIIIPQVRCDIAGNCGIVHGNTA